MSELRAGFGECGSFNGSTATIRCEKEDRCRPTRDIEDETNPVCRPSGGADACLAELE